MSRDRVSTIWRRRAKLSSRKGQRETSFVLYVALMLVVLLVFIAIFLYMRSWLAVETEDSICASQIIAHSALTGISNDQIAPQINCPTRVVDERVSDQEDAKEIIAHEMASCWKQWGRGKISLFGRQEGTYCHICSMVRIEGVSEIENIPLYLEETKMNEEFTYEAYLTNEMADTQDLRRQSGSMSTEQPIAVVFTYHKGFTGIQRLHDWAVGTVLGDNIGTGGLRGAAIVGTGVTVGAVSSAVSIPTAAIVIVGGTALGGGSGMLANMYARPELNETAMVFVRPLEQGQITYLGCDYAPVAND